MTYRQRYKDKAEQLFYMNCCDCLRYGYGLASVPSCGEDEAKRETIWKQAIKDMTASSMGRFSFILTPSATTHATSP